MSAENQEEKKQNRFHPTKCEQCHHWICSEQNLNYVNTKMICSNCDAYTQYQCRKCKMTTSKHKFAYLHEVDGYLTGNTVEDAVCFWCMYYPTMIFGKI